MTAALRSIYADWKHLEPGEYTADSVDVVGRIQWLRVRGRLTFAHLRAPDNSFGIQLIASVSSLGEFEYARWRQNVHVLDQLAVTGDVVRSKTGVLSIFVRSFDFILPE